MIEEKALKLVEESLSEFESPKGSLSGAIQKLKRVAELVENQHVIAWCDLQQGSSEYKQIGEGYVKAWLKYQEDNDIEKLSAKLSEFKKLGFSFKDDSFLQELNAEISEKANESSGGFETIGFIEEKYNDLVRTKRGNDNVYYKSNLNKHLNLIRAHGHKYASRIYKTIAFKDAPKTNFDYLKSAVDDRLLDLNPELAEQLMIVFKTVSGASKEELSQSLTTCRRIIEKFADVVFPPKSELHKGRNVGKSQYINRLWAFIDIVIESE